jgi:hypothetical protein
MPFDPRQNFSYGTVAIPPSPAASGLSLELEAGEGSDFPDPGAQGYWCIVCPADERPRRATAEKVRVTGLAGDTFTITRG